MKRTKIGAILIMCMAFLLTYTQPSYAAKISNESIEAHDLEPGTEKLYQTYYDKLIELQGQYGIAEIISGEYESRLSGLCFAKLVDFNNDGVDELLLSYLACIDEYGYPEYTLEVWEYNGGELEKVFEGDCNFNEEIYNSIKLYAYGNQYFIGQCIMDVDEYVRWWGENSELEWIVGLALFGYVDNAFVPIQSSFYGHDAEYNEMHFLNGERILEENIQDSESYRQWLEYIESPEAFLLTCDASGSELEETLAVLDDTFSILSSEPAEDSAIEDFHEGVYTSGNDMLAITRNGDGYKTSMLIFRLTTFVSEGYMNDGILFLQDIERNGNYHIDWIDENTCIYTFDDETFSALGISSGTSREFTRSDTEAAAYYESYCESYIW